MQREIDKSLARRVSKPEQSYEECPDWFHPGQREAWECDKEIVLVLAGVQSGKSLSGARWLRREIQRTAEKIVRDEDPPNDYLLAGPTLSLLRRKAIPELLRTFPNEPDWGQWDKANSIYHFSPAGARRLCGFETTITIYCGYADNPDSLASMTAKGVWIDEAGQKQFKRDSFEEINNRTTTTGARIFISTTAYVQAGWLRELHDEAEQGSKTVGLVRYKSVDLGHSLIARGNALNEPKMVARGEKILEKVERDRQRLPAWKFAMRREGRFARAPGAVYDCFDGEFLQVKGHTCDRFEIPKDWKRWWGLDFGPVHTCCVMAAECPRDVELLVDGKKKTVKKRLYVYGCYFPQEKGDGRRTYRQHSLSMLAMNMRYSAGRENVPPQGVFGGAKNEENHRSQFCREGIPVQPPRFENDVVRQVEATYGALKEYEVVVFNDLKEFIGEILMVSYEVDDEQNVDDTKILDKGSLHRHDAFRYLVATVKPGFVSDPKTVSRFEGKKKEEALPFRM